VVTLGSKIAAKSVHFLLFILIAVGNSGNMISVQRCALRGAQWHCVAIR